MNKWLNRFTPGITAVILTVAVALAACTEDAISPFTESTPSSEHSEMRTPDGLSTVVAGISRAFALQSIRSDILAAMRKSTRVEHSILLLPYLGSPMGAGLLAASADALGVKESEFLAQVETLGEMEIVVPIRGHRLTWTGSGGVVVAGSLNPELLQVVAHEPSGLRTALQYRALQRYEAFFLIRPRETFGTRIRRQPDVPGPVIQDPDDGEHAIIATWRAKGRDPVTVDYGRFDSEEALRAHLAMQVGVDFTAPPAGDCSGSTGNTCDSGDSDVTDSPTILDEFVLTFASEPGTEEVEITVGYGSVSNTLRFEGVVAHRRYTPEETILSVSPAPNGTRFFVSAVETDWVFDDDLGYATFGYAPGGVDLDLSRISIALSW
jgi:hypothetical protein